MSVETSRAESAPPPPSPPSLPTARDLVRFLGPYRWLLVAAFIALLVAAVAELSIGQALRLIVDQAFEPENAGQLNRYFLIMLGIGLLAALAGFLRFVIVFWLGELVVADVRRGVFDHVTGLSPSFFEETQTGEVLSRLTTDTTLVQYVVASVAPSSLRSLFLLIGGTGLLIYTSVKLATVVLVLVPLTVLPLVLAGRWLKRLARASQDGIAAISAAADESLGSLQTVQAFNHEALDRQRFASAVRGAYRISMRRNLLHAGLASGVTFLLLAAVTAVLWVGANDVVENRISTGELAAFVMYAVVVAASFGTLSESWLQLQKGAGALERLLELLRVEPAIRTPPEPLPLPQTPQAAIRFEQVEFRYPTRPEIPALSDFSLAIAPGETVALVGPSGSGKSTVFKLLLRFYDVSHGRILLDNVDIAEADPQAVRGRFSFVSQDPVIFGASVSWNIGYGLPEATEEEIRAAAGHAAALEFVESLPQGFDTFLGEKGTRLSGGQRQRLAIARAILRKSAVLLFDEATSALDSESERLVQQALERMAAERTTLVIAHRLATVLKADRIVVMDQGRVVAQGTHHSLMRECSLYARLARLQFEAGAEALETAG